ncbi:EsaB/YukD family protein [Listeria kieliensis]|uniref:Secretion accessory protein EsaB/YukD n=1 Tax=Listeria kieliensis TaxID=1621700 RepID=A0A3D8TR51_9LIST|nr:MULTISPECIES: EsaB/YukD family protein [Listeria]RDX01183.1 hypothetical protein UR08_09590 [Listeria kieliensis]
MAKETHLNVTVDFSKWGAEVYDLRIPVGQPVRALIDNLKETLKIDMPDASKCSIKAVNKGILLSDDDKMVDYPITNGDILEIL